MDVKEARELVEKYLPNHPDPLLPGGISNPKWEHHEGKWHDGYDCAKSDLEQSILSGELVAKEEVEKQKRECWDNGCKNGEVIERSKQMKRISELEKEVERLSELLWGSRCVYCGEVVGKDMKNQDIADDFLRKHVEQCPKHPVAELKSKLSSSIPKTVLLTEDEIVENLKKVHGGFTVEIMTEAKALVQAQQAKIEGAK